MKFPPYFNHDPQKAGPQYLEDLATGYWFSEALFTAVELDIFTVLEGEGRESTELSRELALDPVGLQRFLKVLCTLGLVVVDQGRYFNTKVSSDFLVKGRKNYQGESILWRKYLSSQWRDLTECLKKGGRVSFSSEEKGTLEERTRRYIRGMDSVARMKVKEILPIFHGLPLEGEILDVGAGSGAVAAGFLEKFPALQATLADLSTVLQFAKEGLKEKGLRERFTFTETNLLEPWPFEKERYQLVILSNIIHAYGEKEGRHNLKSAVESLKPGGYLVVHDFFREHIPSKAALFDLNMFINTYNGEVFEGKWIQKELESLNLFCTGLVPLESDTAVLIAAKDPKDLEKLSLDPRSLLALEIKELGFAEVCPISVDSVHVPHWGDLRCRYGCGQYGDSHCPPHSPSPEKTKEVLRDYTRALILQGEPPTGDFQSLVLQAEKEAFQAGYYKAFVFWAGPCSLCSFCEGKQGGCCNTRNARPSMEGAGIDVFETVRRAGLTVETLKKQGEFIKYFALLLLE
ncbi:DUF2284 domain-containing protein [Candidatus Contubernalis alkaliaceticus]|uniref:DUF2284 domain-containing protein n=1 Tax=Candidatus Contubernalis alkaliaceticus TaxID=338645 RepID=UPI001F4C24C5|nr:DUF2284 domain-containing protein [Candidatus Contubernalis alkalaceticus]UNC90989.1 methyltransferase domain-containing protein [Candidatus Contubernalis alkalaceticus]